MKIIFCIGETVGLDTVVKKGILDEDIQQMFIQFEDKKILLNDLKKVELNKMYGFGTMVKIINGSDTIFLSVPRIFLNIGSGFAIINYFKTKKAKQLLDLSMDYQINNKL